MRVLSSDSKLQSNSLRSMLFGERPNQGVPDRFRRLHRILVSLAVVMSSAFILLSVWAFGHWSHDRRLSTPLPVVAPTHESFKTPPSPSERGGEEALFADVSVLNRPSESVESLSPSSPDSIPPFLQRQEQARLQADDPPANEPQTDDLPANKPQTDDPPANESQADDLPANKPQMDDPPANEPQTDDLPANEPQTDGSPANKSQADDLPANEPQMDDPPANKPQMDDPPANEPQTDDLPADEPQASVVASKGAVFWTVQVGSFRQESDARRALGFLQKNADTLFSRLHISPAVIEGKGRFFRIQTSGFATRAEALSHCSTLQRTGMDCFVHKE